MGKLSGIVSSSSQETCSAARRRAAWWRFLTSLVACIFSTFCGHSVRAQSLGAASAYNLFTTGGNVTVNGSDSEGAIAATGNITGTNYYAVNSRTSGSTALCASGNINGSYSSYGNAYAMGAISNTITYYNNSSAHANTTAASMPVNFSSADTWLNNENSALYAMGGTTITQNSGGLTFNATQAGVNYFRIDGTSLYTANYINFSSNGKSNVSFIVNVTSVDAIYNATSNPYSNAIFNGTVGTMVDNQQNLMDINKVLFNLNPSIAGFSATGTHGSVLAPRADFNGEGSTAQADGNLVVKSYNQDSAAKAIELHTQYNGNPTFYTGYVIPVSSSSSMDEANLFYGMGIAALFIGRGGWRRRKRREQTDAAIRL